VWKKDNKLATARMARTSTIEEEVGDADAPATVHIDEQLISSFLMAHRLESLSFTMAWRWMRLLNFKYDTRKRVSTLSVMSVTMLLKLSMNFVSNTSHS
jgi:hypothetical protein